MRSSSALNCRTFSMAIAAWAAKVSTRAISYLFGTEPANLRRRRVIRSIGSFAAEKSGTASIVRVPVWRANGIFANTESAIISSICSVSRAAKVRPATESSSIVAGFSVKIRRRSSVSGNVAASLNPSGSTHQITPHQGRGVSVRLRQSLQTVAGCPTATDL